MANADSGTGQPPGADPGTEPSGAIDDHEQRLPQVAALGQAAQTAMRLGNASGCFATLARQRAVAGDDQAAIVWALTTSSTCLAVLGQLRHARADLAGAREACAGTTVPLLAVAVTQQRIHAGDETTTVGPIGRTRHETDSPEERRHDCERSSYAAAAGGTWG